MKRWQFVALLVVAAALLAARLNQGWYANDDGALGQAAERVLRGEVPHRDFDELYTGLLTYVNAAAFRLGGIASTSMRVPLFLMAMAWVAALYAIARRFAPAAGAALVALIALVWSVPNYPAPMPSWYNLFFATFGALALLRWSETTQRRWLVLAGAAGGVSFLFKLSGIFFVLGGGLAIVAATLPSPARSREEGSSGGALFVAGGLLIVLATLTVPLTILSRRGLLRFMLPFSVLIAAMIVREWGARSTLASRARSLLGALVPFAAGVALPVAAYALVLFGMGALADTVQGVFVTSFRRLDFAAEPPPGPRSLWPALLLGVFLAPWGKVRGDRLIAGIVAGIVAGALALVVALSDGSPAVYHLAWLSAWGLPILAAVGGAALLLARELHQRESGAMTSAAMLAIVAMSSLLVEFPYAIPLYTLYALPLTLLAVMAVVRAGGRTPELFQLTVAAYLLMFGALRILPGTMAADRFAPPGPLAKLDLPRGGILIDSADAGRYTALIATVQELAPGRVMWAGPDSPEVYFLSGVPNRTRTLVDFLGASPSAPGQLSNRLEAIGASLVVIKRTPPHSAPVPVGVIAALRMEYRNAREFPGFTVLWR